MTTATMFDLDVQVSARREQLLAEAEVERLARELPPRRSALRAHLAATLYVLADRLNPECCTLEPSHAPA
jgi:hypothetical protein